MNLHFPLYSCYLHLISEAGDLPSPNVLYMYLHLSHYGYDIDSVHPSFNDKHRCWAACKSDQISRISTWHSVSQHYVVVPVSMTWYIIIIFMILLFIDNMIICAEPSDGNYSKICILNQSADERFSSSYFVTNRQFVCDNFIYKLLIFFPPKDPEARLTSLSFYFNRSIRQVCFIF